MQATHRGVAWRRSVVAFVLVIGSVGAVGGAPPREARGTSVRSHVTIIGDSLVENRGGTYTGAFELRGVRASADGYSGRTMRRGWLCRVNGVRRVVPTPVGSSCGIEGLELIMRMVQNNALGSDLVLALGTNDSVVFNSSETLKNLSAVRSMIGRRRLWLVTVVRLKDQRSADAWNRTAERWCAEDAACRVIPWAAMRVARDKRLYLTDGVHLLERGTRLRAEMIATVVAGP